MHTPGFIYTSGKEVIRYEVCIVSEHFDDEKTDLGSQVTYTIKR